MLPLAGYADRLSVRPGETISFHVANATDAATTARVVRVLSADPNPVGGGVQTAAIPADGLRVVSAPAAQTTPRGSYAVVEPIRTSRLDQARDQTRVGLSIGINA